MTLLCKPVNCNRQEEEETCCKPPPLPKDRKPDRPITDSISILQIPGYQHHISRYSGGDYYNNCAKCNTRMKLGADGQFDTLKKIGCGHKLKNAPLCYF